MTDIANCDLDALKPIDTEQLLQPVRDDAPIKILILYGSLRGRSFSRLLAQECARLLHFYGAETQIYNPSGLPLPDDSDDDHPKV